MSTNLQLKEFARRQRFVLLHMELVPGFSPCALLCARSHSMARLSGSGRSLITGLLQAQVLCRFRQISLIMTVTSFESNCCIVFGVLECRCRSVREVPGRQHKLLGLLHKVANALALRHCVLACPNCSIYACIQCRSVGTAGFHSGGM